MWFNQSNKKKLDAKVRFQHGTFAKQLDRQRRYRRKARFVPISLPDRFLARFGLNSRFKQALAALVLAGVIYGLYFPNYLTITQVEIKGLNEEVAKNIQDRAWQAIHHAPFYNPQQNLWVLNPKLIRGVILQDQRVFAVNQIKKRYREHTLVIEATPRTERFLVSTPERVYDVYNDGLLKGVAGLGVDQWRNESAPRMIKLQLPGDLQNPSGDLINADWVNRLEQIADYLHQHNLPALKYISFGDVLESADAIETMPTATIASPVIPEELALQLTKPDGGSFTVKLDPRGELSPALERFKLLLNQTPAERLNQVVYIDLRLKERGYLCLNGSPCSN